MGEPKDLYDKARIPIQEVDRSRPKEQKVSKSREEKSKSIVETRLRDRSNIVRSGNHATDSIGTKILRKNSDLKES